MCVCAGSGWRGPDAPELLERPDPERARLHRHQELEAPADGEGRGRSAAHRRRHPRRAHQPRDPQDPGVQVEATTTDARSRGPGQVAEATASAQPRGPHRRRMSPRRGTSHSLAGTDYSCIAGPHVGSATLRSGRRIFPNASAFQSRGTSGLITESTI
jgi:hypothetical protein